MDIKRKPIYICCLKETHFKLGNTYVRQNVRGWKKILHVNQKKSGVAILISDKIDLKIKKITRDKE